jgi:6-pyruvoyltetrahydropterin/6-carboxytetrahydropterin synthase
MYQVSVKTSVKSAHQLRDYKGKCEKLHGHNWDIEVIVENESLDEMGVVIDFQVLKDKLDAIVAPFDHTCINTVKPFDEINPTAENFARFIYDKLTNIPEVKHCCRVKRVTVGEDEGTEASYVPDRKADSR